MRQLRTLPNYRIPSNSDDDANGMWKMNAVQRARKGGEWPDPFTPYSATQYYILRQSGSGTSVTDGLTTNVYIPSSGVPGTAYLAGSSWGFGGNNTDALAFNVTNNWGYTGTYAISDVGFGAATITSTFVQNANTVVVQIVAGANTNGSGIWYKEYTASNLNFFGWGASRCGQDGIQMIELPEQDTYGNYQNLTFGTTYTLLLGWPSTPYVGLSAFQSDNVVGTSRTVSVPLGNLTMNWSNPTFSGSGWRATSNGTSTTGGQQQIYGIIF